MIIAAFLLGAQQKESRAGTGQPSVSIYDCGIDMSFVLEVIFQRGSPLKVIIELHIRTPLLYD